MNFTNWIWPDNESLGLEWKVEWEMKGLEDYYSGISFPNAESFITAIKKYGFTQSFNKSEFSKINYATVLPDKQSIMRMISSYRSYPKYRNEQTVDAIFQGFSENKPMKMPIVLKFQNDYRILSGNTRANISLINNIPVKCIVFDLGKLHRDSLIESLTDKVIHKLSSK
jgi:hypothetical protein